MIWYKHPVVLIIATQALFTAGDLLARANMRKGGFVIANFLTVWFVAYTVTRTAATFGQLYVLASVPIGRSMALFGATSIVLVNILGVMLLGEVLTPRSYAGVSLAIAAFLVMAFGA
jgi:multidrug transporter EmrE-like cation transporter